MVTEKGGLNNITLTTDVFERFVKKYRKTYGQAKMTDDQASMWFEHMAYADPQQFEVVGVMLCESLPQAYGITQFVEKLSIMYPTSHNAKATEKIWKLQSEDKSKGSVKQRLSQIMSCIPDLQKRNPQGWREDYFAQMLELLGQDEFLKQSEKLKQQFPEMEEWIRRRPL